MCIVGCRGGGAGGSALCSPSVCRSVVWRAVCTLVCMVPVLRECVLMCVLHILCPMRAAYSLQGQCTLLECDSVAFVSTEHVPWCYPQARPHACPMQAPCVRLRAPCESLWIHLEGGDYCPQTENSH